MLGGDGNDHLFAGGTTLADGGAGDDVFTVSAFYSTVDLTLGSGQRCHSDDSDNDRQGFVASATLPSVTLQPAKTRLGILRFYFDDDQADIVFGDLDSNGNGTIAPGDVGVTVDHFTLHLDVTRDLQCRPSRAFVRSSLDDQPDRRHRTDTERLHDGPELRLSRLPIVFPSNREPALAQLTGTNNADRLSGTESNDYAQGLGGDDVVVLRGGNDLALGGLGNDLIFGGDGNDRLYGNDGDDKLLGGNDDDLLVGGAGNDILDGGGGIDRFFGGEGDDVVLAGDGNDVVRLGAGDDRAYGGEGNDTISGENGADRLFGGVGNDTLYGDGGNDLLFGGSGDDTINAGPGNDLIDGGAGNDILVGDAGINRIFGGDGDDVLGSTGGSYLDGGNGNDMITGAGTILGGDGNDVIRAVGESRVTAGAGNDDVRVAASGYTVDLTLGSGKDTIATSVDANGDVFSGFGAVTVQDFAHGQDKIGALDFFIDNQDVFLGFNDLDGNGDGKIAAGDLGVTLDHNNLQIDVARIYVAEHPEQSFNEAATFNLLGVTELKPTDFTTTVA